MLKRWLPLAAALSCIVLGACAGHSARLATPSLPVPYSETVTDERWQPAAKKARIIVEQARAIHGLPSLTAAVAIDGKVVWAAAAGWSDVETRTPATLTTRYRIGSTSKAVTATLLARLVDRGTMSLDAPARTWAAQLPNPQWLALKPRQLASHSAGIVDYGQNRDLVGLFHSLHERKQFESVMDSLSVFDGNRLKSPPGVAFRYTSFDVVLLSALMEAASGTSFLDLIQREIANPLGATTLSADYQDRPMPDRATFYWRKKQNLRRWRHVNHSYKWAAGGLIASSSDLVRIGSAWLNPEYIQPETREAFWMPQKLANGMVNPQSYAIGWRSNLNPTLLGEGCPLWNVHHGGVSKGAYSWLVIYPEFRLVVAINANARLDEFADFIAIEQAITRAFLASPGLDLGISGTKADDVPASRGERHKTSNCQPSPSMTAPPP